MTAYLKGDGMDLDEHFTVLQRSNGRLLKFESINARELDFL